MSSFYDLLSLPEPYLGCLSFNKAIAEINHEVKTALTSFPSNLFKLFLLF